MKVLFVTNQFFFFRHIEPIASSLLHNGHQVSLWFGNVEKKTITNRAVQDFIKTNGKVNYHRFTERWHKWQAPYRIIRELLGYHIYQKPGFTSSVKKQEFIKSMSSFSRFIISFRITEKILLKEWFLGVLRSFLYNSPVDQKVKAELRDEAPNVVVVVTNLRSDTFELEYAKASMSLGIPTVDLIASWDNLSTKSTFNIIPDAVVLWNDALREEAAKLHGVPDDKIIVAGAETFDYLFNFHVSCSHSEFFKKVGFKADKPFIVYLGSSASMTGDETGFVREIVRNLNARLGIYTLIRPHPLNNKIWEGFHEPGSIIWPITGDLPDTIATQQDLWDTFHHSAAIVGINTSAMIEAAIADKPCITIKSNQYNSSQSENSHFRHLLNGGFLEIADDIDQAIYLIKNIMEGSDRLCEKRRGFVSTFIRPNGMNRPVGPLISKILELLYQKHDSDHIKNQIAQIKHEW